MQHHLLLHFKTKFCAFKPFWLRCLFTLLVFFVLFCLWIYIDLYSNQSYDFQSFYFSIINLAKGTSPYQAYHGITNLNPPFFLLFTYGLKFFSFSEACILWQILSAISVIYGAYLCFKLNQQTTKEWLWIILLCYPTLLNFRLGQVGCILFCLIMIGFDKFKKSNHLSAALFWAVSASLKLFPLLLVFFLIHQKQFKAGSCFLSCFVILSFIPTWIFGTQIYVEYYQAINDINWYGHLWNTSIFGMTFKFFAYLGFGAQLNIAYFTALTLSLSFICYYLYCLFFKTQHADPNNAFSLTLSSMLLINPLSWLYYLPLLTFPICHLKNKIGKKCNTSLTALPACIGLLLCPFIEHNSLPSSTLLYFVLSMSYSLGIISLLWLLNTHHYQQTLDVLIKPVFYLAKSLIITLIIGFSLYHYIVNFSKILLFNLASH